MNDTETVAPVELTRALRRRWPVLLVVGLAAAAVALAISLSREKEYDATVQLLVGRQQNINSLLNPTAGLNGSDAERDIKTKVELIKLESTANAVRERLGLALSPDQILSRIGIETTDGSNIVKLTVSDTDPERAAAIATAFAEEYVAYRERADRRAFREAAELAERQLAALTPEERASEVGAQLEARQNQLEITAALQTGGVELVRRASVPQEPARPRPLLATVVGGFLGLLLAAAAALALEFGDRRLRDEDAVEELFGLPVLASIPRRPKRRKTVDPAETEAYGLLAANLRFSTLNSDANLLMITSSSPQEGKTTVTLNLARSLARLGLRVIALEADLRRPTFANHSALVPSVGLSGVLTGRGKLAQELVWLDASTLAPVSLSARVEGGSFAVLPAGDLPSNPQRMLARPDMEELLKSARGLADVVLIDTAPLGTVNDAVSLAPYVDSVAMVVQLGSTTKDAARRAVRTLHNIDVRLAGVVVVGGESTPDGYGYYHARDEAADGRQLVSPG